jgi:hypothetical protein
MKWEYFGTGITFVGIGITLVLALPPPWWLKMPPILVRIGLLAGLGLIIFGGAITFMGIWPETLRPRLMPVLLMSTGLFIVVAGAVWFFKIDPKHNLLGPPGPTNKHDVVSTNPLAGLTNAQLRERAISFAQSLRAFEATFQASDRALADNCRNSAKLSTLEERAKAWNSCADQSEQRRAHFVGEFKNKFRADAVILREALKLKLGVLPDPPTTHPFGLAAVMAGRDAFEGALLTGPAPVSAGADLLEYWAKQLP